MEIGTAATVNGDITATNHMPKATIQSTCQPLLSSTYDTPSSGFHSILGSASAAGKTKYLAGGSGITVLSTSEGLAWNASPFTGMLATYGFDRMSSSSGMTSYPVDTWGPTFAAVKQVHHRERRFCRMASPSRSTERGASIPSVE